MGPDADAIELGPGIPPVPTYPFAGPFKEFLWSRPALGTIALDSPWLARSHTLDGRGWHVRDTPLARTMREKVGSSSRLRLLLPHQPADEAYFVESRDDRVMAYSVVGDEVVAMKDLGELARALVRLGAPEGCKLTLSPSAAHELHALVEVETSRGRKRLCGLADLDPSSMRPTSFHPFRFEATSFPRDALLGVAVVPRASRKLRQANVLAVAVTWLGESDARRFAFWEFAENRPARIVAEHPQLTGETSERAAAFLATDGLRFEPPGFFDSSAFGKVDLMFAPPAGIILNADSVYHCDLRSRVVSVIFHPGQIHVRVGSEGQLAMFTRFGYKCFVTRLQ